jgi:hypothetical protein
MAKITETAGKEGNGVPPFNEGRFTPDQIRLDNQSPLARAYLTEWKNNFFRGNLSVIWRCSDSRFVVPAQGVAEVGSIAAAAHPGFLLTVPGRVNILMNHEPCGGRSVKKVQEEQGPQPGRTDSAAYVERFIYSSEPDYNGMANGLEVAKVTKRPTLIVTQEHRTGKLEPVTIILPHRGASGEDMYQDPLINEAIMEVLETGRYSTQGRDPEAFNAFNPIVTPFIPFLNRYSETLSGNIKPDDSIIDPTTVLVTTEFAGLQRFPKTLGAKRNTVFTVTVPPIQPDGSLAEGHIKDQFDQVHYPIAHALGNPEQDPNKPFARLANGGTLLLEANHPLQLLLMVNEVNSRPYVREWAKKPNNNIYCLLSNDGEVQGIGTPEQVTNIFAKFRK